MQNVLVKTKAMLFKVWDMQVRVCQKSQRIRDLKTFKMAKRNTNTVFKKG